MLLRIHIQVHDHNIPSSNIKLQYIVSNQNPGKSHDTESPLLLRAANIRHSRPQITNHCSSISKSQLISIHISIYLFQRYSFFPILSAYHIITFMGTLVGKQSDTDIVIFCIPYYIFPFKFITIDSILIIQLYLIYLCIQSCSNAITIRRF